MAGSNKKLSNSILIVINSILIIIALVLCVYIVNVDKEASVYKKYSTGIIATSRYCEFFNSKIDSTFLNFSFFTLTALSIFLQVSVRKSKVKTPKFTLFMLIETLTIIGCWILEIGFTLNCSRTVIVNDLRWPLNMTNHHNVIGNLN